MANGSEVQLADMARMVLAAGALGTAAAGIVDAFKFSARFRSAGFGQLVETLGAEVVARVEAAYGGAGDRYLRALYLDQRSSGGLGKALRQGIRLAFTPTNVPLLAPAFGQPERVDALAEVATAIAEGRALDDAQRGLLGRFELAVDTRIEAALVLAENRYVASMRLWSMGVALVIALVAAVGIGLAGPDDPSVYDALATNGIPALIVGLVAVPLAPIAKDVASGIRNARNAIGAAH